MVINYTNNFIFMHSRKTAGSTITAALNKFLGPEDLQLGAWPDTLETGGRLNQMAKRIALRNPSLVLLPTLKKTIKNRRLTVGDYAVNEAIRLHFYKKGLRAGTHSSAEDVRDFDPEFWERAFKFCFVRNPWTHAVSDFHWRTHSQQISTVDFKEFLYRLYDRNRPDPEGVRPPITTNWSIYTIEDEIALDYVARYENLSDELKEIGRQAGIKIDVSGISSKGNVRDKNKRYESYYDDEAIELVRQIYRNEIDAFGYVPFV